MRLRLELLAPAAAAAAAGLVSVAQAHRAAHHAQATAPTPISRIAFTNRVGKRVSIYSVRVDGEGRVRLSDASVDDAPSWSPDGKRIAFQRGSGSFDLYLMDAHGRNERRLTKTADGEAQPAWSPDGKRIAFLQLRRGQLHNDICLLELASRQVRCITHNTARFAFATSPAWSPDGRRLAFVSFVGALNRGIQVINVDGTGRRRLTRGRALDDAPAWSPDGTRIAFSSAAGRNPGFGVLNPGSEIFVMNADGSARRRLTRNKVFDGYPAWSPRGTVLAFSRTTGAFGGWPANLDIYTMGPTGHNVHRLTLTPSSESRPAWQPIPAPAPSSPTS
jgi:TolB protein